MAKRFVLLGVALLFLYHPVLAEDGPISIKRSYVPPKSKIANIIIQARIEKHEDNRGIFLFCESAENYRSSSMTINGADSSIVTRFEFFLSAGDYKCRGELERSGNKKFYSLPIRIFFMGW